MEESREKEEVSRQIKRQDLEGDGIQREGEGESKKQDRDLDGE